MSEQPPDQATTTGPDPGLRTLRRLALAGTAAGVLLALVVGLIGGSGRDAAAVLLLLLALTAATIGLVGVVTMALDEHRGIEVARARIAVTIGGFLGATLLMAMLVGVGG